MKNVPGLLVSGIAATAVLAAAPAQAMVTIETSISDIRCGITSLQGTVFGNCDTPSFAATIEPGQTAFLRGTLDYHYRDDGLAALGFLQVDSLGKGVVVDHEAGVIHVDHNLNGCPRIGPCLPGNVSGDGTVWTPLVLGVNDRPDDISGSIDVFVELSVRPDTVPAYTTTLALSTWSQSIAAPIPEPATVALMASGLLALGLAARRRRESVNPAAVA